MSVVPSEDEDYDKNLEAIKREQQAADNATMELYMYVITCQRF